MCSDSRLARSKELCAGQVVDEQQGPRTRKEYTIAHVPVGAGSAGQVVDFLIRPLDAQLNVAPPSAASLRAATAPLLGTAPDMDAREQICEALTTGIKVWRGLRLCSRRTGLSLFSWCTPCFLDS